VQFHELPSLFHHRGLPQSSSASRFTAGASGFLNLSQSVGRAAEPGDVILLSPGFTSFGLFLNEFDRGNQFRELVLGL